MFKHAGKSGAQIFDQTKVESLEFMPTDEAWESDLPNPGRPVSARWSRKDGSSGIIKFDDIIDASGRAGIVTTKYLKNRKYNQGLKNIATWGYFKNTGFYGVGTHKEGQPYFQALQGKYFERQFIFRFREGAKKFHFRCHRLGLDYSPSQWYHIRRCRP